MRIMDSCLVPLKNKILEYIKMQIKTANHLQNLIKDIPIKQTNSGMKKLVKNLWEIHS